VSGEDLHGEAGISMRALEETESDEAAIGIEDETPAARWSGIAAAPATDPLETGDDEQLEVPRSVMSYLMDDETDIIAVRLHECLLLTPALAAVGGLLVAITLNSLLYATGKAGPILVYTLWALWGIALIWAACRWLEWRQTWFLVTGHRVMLVHAKYLIGRTVDQLPIDKMRDLRLDRPVVGRICGYGTLDFASIGTEGALDMVRFLPHPDWLYREICALKMPDTERKVITRRARR
jgi:hypothetical protein